MITFPTSSRRGFTLIELLVVIAIIAILAAILFPVFAQAKLAAKKTQTLSNVKNIGTAFQLYAGDYDDLVPPFSGNASDPATFLQLRYTFAGLVDPYIKNGVNTTSGELKDIWADPLTKPQLNDLGGIRNTFAYNVYGLGGFSRACISQVPADYNSAICTSRAPATWGEFASTLYNTPASLSGLSSSAETLLMVTGQQFARAPQFAVANDGSNGQSVGIYGSITAEGDRLLQSTIPAGTANKAVNEKLYVGDMAVVAYCDSHAKVVKNATLWSNQYSAANGRWRGNVVTGPMMNKGWSRDWPTQ